MAEPEEEKPQVWPGGGPGKPDPAPCPPSALADAKPQNVRNGPPRRVTRWPFSILPPPDNEGGQNCLSWEGTRNELTTQHPQLSHPLSLPPLHPQLAQKYDPQREQELREWIEGVTGRHIGSRFMDGLKDGIILCE